MEEGDIADPRIFALERRHDEPPAAVERQRLGPAGAIEDIVIGAPALFELRGIELLQPRLPERHELRIISDQAAMLGVRGDDDGAAILAVFARGILGEHGAQGVRDGDPRLLVDECDALSLIVDPFRHAHLTRLRTRFSGPEIGHPGRPVITKLEYSESAPLQL